MPSRWLIVEQVTTESIGDPPQIVVARLNEVVMELNQCGVHHTLWFCNLMQYFQKYGACTTGSPANPVNSAPNNKFPILSCILSVI